MTDTQAKPVLTTIPEGRLAIIPMKSTTEIGKKVDNYLVQWRKERVAAGQASDDNGYCRDSFIVEANTPRFGTGEGKGMINESVRGSDLYVMVDVTNPSR